MKIVVGVEFYRTPEQGADSDDYMVDGMKLIHINIPDDLKNRQDDCDTFFLALITTILEGIRKDAIAQSNYPKFTALVKSEKPFWFHVTTAEGLAKRPQDFHGNNFSEAELLGIPVEEELSILYSSAGIRLDGPPDKFMLSIGAI